MTGAGGGIGERFARDLAGHGADPVITARSTGRLESLAAGPREEVVRTGLRAYFHGSGPTVVSGGRNRLLATGYRFVPRAVMARFSAIAVR